MLLTVFWTRFFWLYPKIRRSIFKFTDGNRGGSKSAINGARDWIQRNICCFMPRKLIGLPTTILKVSKDCLWDRQNRQHKTTHKQFDSKQRVSQKWMEMLRTATLFIAISGPSRSPSRTFDSATRSFAFPIRSSGNGCSDSTFRSHPKVALSSATPLFWRQSLAYSQTSSLTFCFCRICRRRRSWILNIFISLLEQLRSGFVLKVECPRGLNKERTMNKWWRKLILDRQSWAMIMAQSPLL